MSGAARTTALIGSSSWAPHDVPKRGIGPEDINFADEKRALGWGWQSIANVRGVNQIDLRRACRDPALDPTFAAKPVAAKAKPAAKGGDAHRRGTSASGLTRTGRAESLARFHKILGAIEDGHGSPIAIAAHLGLPMSMVAPTVYRARRENLIAGSARPGGGGLLLTEAGRRELTGQADG